MSPLKKQIVKKAKAMSLVFSADDFKAVMESGVLTPVQANAVIGLFVACMEHDEYRRSCRILERSSFRPAPKKPKLHVVKP